MHYRAMKKHGGNSAFYLVKEANLKKAAYCMIPNIWHSGKCKIVETGKRLTVTSVCGEGETKERNRIFRARKGV